MKQTVQQLFSPFKVRVDEKGKVVKKPENYNLFLSWQEGTKKYTRDSHKPWLNQCERYNSAKEVSHAVNWMEYWKHLSSNVEWTSQLTMFHNFFKFSQTQPQKEDFIGENAIWEGWEVYHTVSDSIEIRHESVRIRFYHDGTIEIIANKGNYFSVINNYSDLLHELEKEGVLLILKD